LKKPNTSIVECHFDEYFDQQLRELEGSSVPKETGSAEPINFSEPGLSDEPPPLPVLLSRGKILFRQVTILGVLILR
jgi:signal recognition particle receptor subunit alpha